MTGCTQELDSIDGIYYDWSANTNMFCAINLDTVAGADLDNVLRGLDRARDRKQVIGLYAHVPGDTVPLDKLTAVLDGAVARGLDFVTFPELSQSDQPRGGIALDLDDDAIDAWTAYRPELLAHNARVTLFVTRFDLLQPNQVAELHQFDADGDAIEAHSARHLNAPDYVTEHGLQAYLDNEALPSITNLENSGFHPTAYAYPFGARSDELDNALLKLPNIERLRSVNFVLGGLVSSPCPN